MKRIFLTGGSSGIGLATAQALLARGEEVWATSRNPAALPKHERLHPVVLDLRDKNEIERAFARSLREAGHFDVVINNAGSGHFGPGEFLSSAEIEEQFQILFFAHVRLMQLALAEMRQNGAGLIINVTSLAALLPVPFMGAYNAAKSAMAAFTMSIQLELGPSKVRIVDLQPGDIHTNFNEAVTRGSQAGYGDRVAKTWLAVDRNLKAGPKPELVARHILRLIDQRDPPSRILVGDWFQTKIAPFLFRFLPQRVRVWGLKKYYGI
jgi:NAD(P)-dependent dehydrogenase (short-subunit alcohol dehydrogenase family)